MNPRVKTVVATDSHKLEITFSNGGQDDQFVGFLGRFQLDF